MMDYMVNLGLMISVMQQYPPHVAENLEERVIAQYKSILREIEIIQAFGEAFDERPTPEDDDDGA